MTDQQRLDAYTKVITEAELKFGCGLAVVCDSRKQPGEMFQLVPIVKPKPVPVTKTSSRVKK